jgi:hypothetical protein
MHAIVDNRVFLLGLDELYREAMKEHEVRELLRCAARTAEVLRIAPGHVPIEGYYAESAELTAYFRLLRVLQHQPKSRSTEVSRLEEYQRLLAVTSSPIFGRPVHGESLLPVGRDPLSEAMSRTEQWSLATLVPGAQQAARETDDFSLVGLAAFASDAVVLAALRESVVLYAELMFLGLPAEPTIEWRVDADLALQAARFVDAFNALFPVGRHLPAPVPENRKRFWDASDENAIVGRCTRLGTDASGTSHYHWAIRWGMGSQLMVEEFWRPDIWTTTRYRESQPFAVGRRAHRF